ncbi:MAG: FAD-dependent oxidoreductase [Acetobacteraceae bacterium]|nr:FAD-dependent oxidoreductase [Acetobacteraceae bacterium]
MGEEKAPEGPDLTQGVPVTDLPAGGMVAGRVGEDAVLVARSGEEFFAIGATCTHYGGPLAEGLVVGDTVRCPWHHACFSLRTGEALRAPAFDPVSSWQVERQGDRIFVREKLAAPLVQRAAPTRAPERVVIVGGGAAGFAAAERLRREGYSGALTMLSDDADAPYDRPNLSKDYLAGKAPEEWIPLRPASFYADSGIDLRVSTAVGGIDPNARRVLLADGGEIAFDCLLIATGAEPIRPPIPGADARDILTLRTVRDCRAIIARAEKAHRAVLVGAGFIGLEVAASLRQRGLEVELVGPNQRPLEKVLGPPLADLVRPVHEAQGVRFHLGEEVASMAPGRLTLKTGKSIDVDVIILGTGVTPRTALAEAAGLAVADGILVDEYLETSIPGIFAAGDVARWPDPYSGERIRVEHWVVAERMGQAAALNILGAKQRFAAVPFFWSQHYDDLIINYIGHATRWDEIAIDGDLAANDAVLRYRSKGRTLAVATVGRDRENLSIEAATEEKQAFV